MLPFAAERHWCDDREGVCLGFLKCTSAEACPGGNATSLATCSEGSYGRMCGKCDTWFFKDESGVCR